MPPNQPRCSCSAQAWQASPQGCAVGAREIGMQNALIDARADDFATGSPTKLRSPERIGFDLYTDA